MALRLPVLTHPAFAREFRHNADQLPYLDSIPVWHVRSPQAGLFGAALHGLLRQVIR
jgi:glucokinase